MHCTWYKRDKHILHALEIRCVRNSDRRQGEISNKRQHEARSEIRNVIKMSLRLTLQWNGRVIHE